ncbi:ribosome biogenesis GTPase YlqF [Crenobacter cavernae]|uniref:Ribosome biogenesis GTPase A n=1 Tax=Crenobacter cavernae TaxID=2290923 RepID=A0ABY0FC08_9NEIS|nr:ribosome biogenesis GTPase YlqF [Crenobacter cavernae]RXZ43599.1 ribosome biogenesis GTPase YlqF [Crenobacter cavernae]
MAIQWFPGHMNKAKKQVADRLKGIDVVIEMLDARLPASSANPMLAGMTSKKKALKILNKQDLADPTRTRVWIDYYNGLNDTRAIGLDAGDKSPAQRLISACREIAPHRSGLDKPLRVLICGIPNVGKSTLINSLLGRRAAKVGNEPGITKGEQRIDLADDFILYDTPGMLWPKILVEQGGYNLAASGAVGRNALDEEEVTLELLKYLIVNYPADVEARYKLDGVAEMLDDQLLEAIGRRRGAMLGGGRVNFQKTAEIVLTDFRDGTIGRITLETPEEWKDWLTEARRLDAERQSARDLAKAERAAAVKKRRG